MGLLGWKISQNEANTKKLAENQARANFNKDKAFRLWLTSHGRLYIPVGKKYQPDPYLAHIEDRDITTPSGIKLSLINPARIIRDLDRQYSDFYGVSGRVTSLTPIRPQNAPDPWEREALHKLDQGVQEIFEYTTIEGEPFLRLIQPLPLKKGCLLCHPYLASKTNEVGGGVTIALPMNELLDREAAENSKDIQLFSIIWLLGILGIAYANVFISRQVREKGEVIAALAASQSRNTASMESAMDCIITIDSSGMVTDVNPATSKTFGYKRSEMVNQDLAELIIPLELRERHRAGIKRLMETGVSTLLNSRIETRGLRADGQEIPVELAITRIDDDNGTYFTAFMRDLTEAHELKEELTYQASHDALTGLVNRRAFETHLERVIDESVDDSEHCLLYMDLDQFKVVNDSNGHVAGDQLLRQLGQLLSDSKRSSDTLARLGGDEFALILEGCPLEKAKNIASALIEVVKKYRFYWDDKVYTIGISIGMAPVKGHSIGASELLSDADVACYKAKEDGGNRYHVFQHDDEELVRRRGELDWISRIQDALQQNRFQLHKQVVVPISSQADNSKLHFEVLLRMLDKEDNLISPVQFIPAAERYNLMSAVDKWVIDKTFQWLSEQENLLDTINLCSINLSGLSINDSFFASYVKERLNYYKLPTEIICFEITETVAISNLSKATSFMEELRSIGCQFALDDFGSGVSSFGYLKNLPVDYLKIDGEFVKDISTNPINLALVKSINEIGHIMGKKTIAEFVEDDRAVELLSEIGVDYAQGYVFSRPVAL